jgi:hypothetical protein
VTQIHSIIYLITHPGKKLYSNFFFFAQCSVSDPQWSQCGSGSGSSIYLNEDPDPAVYFNEDPDPPVYLNEDPDPAVYLNEDPDPAIYLNEDPDLGFAITLKVKFLDIFFLFLIFSKL